MSKLQGPRVTVDQTFRVGKYDRPRLHVRACRRCCGAILDNIDDTGARVLTCLMCGDARYPNHVAPHWQVDMAYHQETK